MKIFVIHPIRNISPTFSECIHAAIEQLEREGFDVYDPQIHTYQDNPTGLGICCDNRTAIENSDLVAFIWDGQSQGCLFDLGMAFSLRKKIRCVIGMVPRMSQGKSFQNMAYEWEEIGPDV